MYHLFIISNDTLKLMYCVWFCDKYIFRLQKHHIIYFTNTVVQKEKKKQAYLWREENNW